MERDISLISSVRPLPAQPQKCRPAGVKDGEVSFQEALRGELARSQKLKLSAHAEKRLKERNIMLADEDLARLERAVQLAEARGARESLLIYGNLALIASVKNRTVVTAMDGQASDSHVFTNIDSAVLVK